MLTCSTAAGPAFEGACIYQGMRAVKGAIERVTIEQDDVKLVVIDDSRPLGLCGSGLIDAVAQMLDAGILNHKGNIPAPGSPASEKLSPNLAARLRKGPDGNEFVLAWNGENEDIVITQKDIREVQLAKGAIFAGISILLKSLKTDSSNLQEIMLAGAFGSHINKKSALRVGLLPDVPPEKITYIGNAAGAGACMALMSANTRSQAEKQSREVIHVELGSHPGFEKEYLNAMYFPCP
jgi:uncharacterized 2Fe-2S/4Fe-4S cluster protein (DUF4445 family)